MVRYLRVGEASPADARQEGRKEKEDDLKQKQKSIASIVLEKKNVQLYFFSFHLSCTLRKGWRGCG
jgi:hypothetical protein